MIVVLTEINHDIIHTYPSTTTKITTDTSYSHNCTMTLSIATFIQNIKYRTMTTINDTSQYIPYTIQTKLNEYSRHNLLIHPKFGPQIQIGQIHTNLPLHHNKPIRFNMHEFYEICHLCSNSCPPQTIPTNTPQNEIINQSNIINIQK